MGLRSTCSCPSTACGRAPASSPSQALPPNHFRAAPFVLPNYQRSIAGAPVGRRRCTRRLAAARDGNEASSSNSSGSLERLELAVPAEQRPVNELAALRQAVMYSWATLDTQNYLRRLGIVWLGFFMVVGCPIAYQTFDPRQQPLDFFLSGMIGALLVVAVAVLRIYLGWAYVGDRLLSAAVEYEETGWYDGQLFVKPPEVLARDRLLGTYEVKPALARLKGTLVGAACALALTGGLLLASVAMSSDSDGAVARPTPRTITPEGVLYSKSVRSLSQLKSDDEAAEAESLAQGGVPGYCGDRYFKSFAGGQYCGKFETKKR